MPVIYLGLQLSLIIVELHLGGIRWGC